MLAKEENEALTRVGPDTLMGNFLREYWIPAMLSSELPHPDCDPVRVMMLGERLIGFRDSTGKAGLIQDLCPHRGASLFFGRNEESGIRCVYHGWKFDTEGRCVDMPNEPPESNFKDRVRAVAYPVVERAGLLFVYMGSRQVPPPLPDIEATLVEQGMYVTATMVPANWLQVLEGNIDTAHAVFLHSGAAEPEWYPEGSFNYYNLKQRWATFTAADTDYGAIYGAFRPGPDGYNYWRIGQFLFPCWTNSATGYLGHKVMNDCWVPMDDTHTMVYRLTAKVDNGQGVPTEQGPNGVARAGVLSNTSGWFGRFNTEFNAENDFLMDREEQRELGSFAGMPYGVGNEDTAVQVSMGEIQPREIENLGTSDLMVIRVRQRLLEAALAFGEHKIAPPALDTPAVYATRCGTGFIPEDADWLEYIEPYTKAFVDHGEPDRSLMAGPSVNPRGYRHKRPGPMF